MGGVLSMFKHCIFVFQLKAKAVLRNNEYN